MNEGSLWLPGAARLRHLRLFWTAIYPATGIKCKRPMIGNARGVAADDADRLARPGFFSQSRRRQSRGGGAMTQLVAPPRTDDHRLFSLTAARCSGFGSHRSRPDLLRP